MIRLTKQREIDPYLWVHPDEERDPQKNPAPMSSPNESRQREASKPTQQNSAMILNGRASVCAFAASLLKTVATIVFMAVSHPV
jgi:hypothetical protein